MFKVCIDNITILNQRAAPSAPRNNQTFQQHQPPPPMSADMAHQVKATIAKKVIDGKVTICYLVDIAIVISRTTQQCWVCIKLHNVCDYRVCQSGPAMLWTPAWSVGGVGVPTDLQGTVQERHEHSTAEQQLPTTKRLPAPFILSRWASLLGWWCKNNLFVNLCSESHK